MAEHEVILEMKNICKTFPGVRALDNVSFTLKKGTVHSLMGENGAGKSTLMKCAFGLYDIDEGEVTLEGENVRFSSALEGLQHGISMIHQELNPIPRRSLAENIWIGRIPVKKFLGLSFVDHKKMYDDTQALFDDLHMSHINPQAQAMTVSASIIQLCDIARSVSYGAKIIIMDEPTSSLTGAETQLLFQIIRRLTSQGVGIVYISHKIDEILQISDEVTIMRDGKNVGTWEAGELTEAKIVSNMVGREMSNWFPVKDNVPGEKYLEVKNYSSIYDNSFQDCSFSVRKGEIFGVGGLVGAQRTELLEAVFGDRSISSGELFIGGEKVSVKSTTDAIKHNMGLLTEERRATGIFPGLSVLDNVSVASLPHYSNALGFLKLKELRADTEAHIEALSIKTPSMKTMMANLSGGNQQKVIVSRWLMNNPDILILDEPTRGIDVGAKYEIYNIMLDLAKQGKTIIMISSELPELLAMSDRVMVMCEGRVSAILEGDDLNEATVMEYASRVGGLSA